MKTLSTPARGAKELSFPTKYSQSFWTQIVACLWKTKLTYWRSPDYNCVRFFFTFMTAFIIGSMFWGVGKNVWVHLLADFKIWINHGHVAVTSDVVESGEIVTENHLNQTSWIMCRTDEVNLFSILGGMFSAVLFLGINNASNVQPVVAVERTIFYRERAAGMYSAVPYALGQVSTTYTSHPDCTSLDTISGKT